MANNPLQQFFRQPKIYIGLPSQGIYNAPGEIEGDISHMPVYGMTGMDEILLRTPDALFSGDSTVKVLQSCVPSIKDAWKLCVLDVDLVLASVRIATYGSDLTISRLCEECQAENEYTFNLSKLIEHYQSCSYDNTVVVGDLTIITRPLNYKQSTEFSLKNFQIQQQLVQIASIEDEEEKRKATTEAFNQLAQLRNEIFTATIESVDTGSSIVTERAFITEWINNADRATMEALRDHGEKNQQAWTPPKQEGECQECGHKNLVTVSLDQSSFFGKA